MTTVAIQRRERNALVLLRLGGGMQIHRRDNCHQIGRNALGHAWLSTLHSLERQRLVERKRTPVGLLFVLTEPAGAVVADVHVALRSVADGVAALPIRVYRRDEEPPHA